MPHLLHDPHHDGSARYVSDEAPRLSDTVTVRCRTAASDPVDAVWLRTTYDAEPVFHVARRTEEGAVTWWEASLPVHNPVTHYRFLLVRGEEQAWLTGAGVVEHDVPDAGDFVLSAYPVAPDWARDGVVYQVFPDRFARSKGADARELPEWAEPAAWDDPVDNDRAHTAVQFYGGDLAGVEQHLDHLARLGVDLLYLTPVFPARSNHRYLSLIHI